MTQDYMTTVQPPPSPAAIEAAGKTLRDAIKRALLWMYRNYQPFFAASVAAMRGGIEDAYKEIE